ncbi:MAG: HAD-IA family hydrolase [Anaerolineae bacterium]|nr:HAD-IA family hydrolase [Anaerolineae bacterium]
MIKALIFDFDGTIFDSEFTEYISWKETYDSFGVTLPQDKWLNSIGGVGLFDPYDYLEKLVGRSLEKETILTRRRQRDVALAAQQPVMPGVMDYLLTAKQLGLKTAVASSSEHSWVDASLERLGIIHHFDWISCRDDVGGKAKPNPDVYLAALAALGVAADEALALEDSPNGMIAAQKAGIFCVVVPNQLTSQLPFPQPDYRLTSLADMPLKQLLGHVSANGAPYLNSNAKRIREFHAAVGAPLPISLTMRNVENLALRKKLIDEEYQEVTAVYQQIIAALEAEQELDPVETLTPLAHELADLLYVVYGAIESFGIDADAVFREVHRANLQKAGGPRREDGKILKPPGWQPANVKSVIEKQ